MLTRLVDKLGIIITSHNVPRANPPFVVEGWMHGMVAHFVHHAHDFCKVPLVWTLTAKNMLIFVNWTFNLD
jgi:hypothetical protein